MPENATAGGDPQAAVEALQSSLEAAREHAYDQDQEKKVLEELVTKLEAEVGRLRKELHRSHLSTAHAQGRAAQSAETLAGMLAGIVADVGAIDVEEEEPPPPRSVGDVVLDDETAADLAELQPEPENEG